MPGAVPSGAENLRAAPTGASPRRRGTGSPCP